MSENKGSKTQDNTAVDAQSGEEKGKETCTKGNESEPLKDVIQIKLSNQTQR
jgi:hypothetical protein